MQAEREAFARTHPGPHVLQVLGCMKLAQLSHTWLYKVLGLVFVAQFFALRMVVSNAYMVQLARIVLALAERPWWAWTGAWGDKLFSHFWWRC